MRIVAGSARGRRLQSPPGSDTRPTTDRVREAVFNSLNSAGVIAGATVLDLFAGSGAMGLEALSRGASAAIFVESAPAALKVLRANIDDLGFGDAATIVPADALAYLDAAPRVDVAVCDPPYSFDDWPAILDRLDAEVVVVESDRPVALGERWASFKQGRYAATVVELAWSVG